MTIDVKLDIWEQVKVALDSNCETVIFDSRDYERMFIVVWVNSYNWSDCLDCLTENIDKILGGCWVNSTYYPKELEKLIGYHKNKASGK